MRLQSSSLGQLKAELAESVGLVSDDLIDKLNGNCRPPEKLRVDDVHIRAMYIVSDEVNSYGGRFPADEHERLVELLTDAPVLVGHRQDKLPVGRTFHALQVERDGKPWVKSYFYWLKSADRAENLLKNIDGGVYKECSIGFSFRLPECSVCGKDIRLCEHEPFAKYPMPGGETVCHFNYRQIEKVLETSLVYRGAIRNTSISNELSHPPSADLSVPQRPTLHEISALDQSAEYLILPRYDSIPGRLSLNGDTLLMIDENGNRLLKSDLSSTLSVSDADEIEVRLVGMRGKERCSLTQLMQYLDCQSGPVSRLILYTLTNNGIVSDQLGRLNSRIELKQIPSRRGPAANLDRLAREIMTRDGVEIWSLDRDGNLCDGYYYQPGRASLASSNGYRLLTGNGRTGNRLELTHKNLAGTLVIHNFDKNRSTKGGQFVAEMESSHPMPESNRISSGSVAGVTKQDDGYLIELEGPLQGKYALRPIRLSGRERWLFYRGTVSAAGPELSFARSGVDSDSSIGNRSL